MLAIFKTFRKLGIPLFCKSKKQGDSSTYASTAWFVKSVKMAESLTLLYEMIVKVKHLITCSPDRKTTYLNSLCSRLSTVNNVYQTLR
jgi:hypothetical protein